MQVINTNVMSLNAQRNLSTSSSSLATSIQRLSSGLRINSAKDDAAGLAIASRFTTQIRGLDQASRNANDAISLSQTAEGALGEVQNNLQRIRELAIQSRNATNSASDRQALQAEVAQLKSEIQRVAEQTTFNGLNLLDGSFTTQSFQVGANQGDLIDVDAIVNSQIDALGTWTRAAVTGTAASYTTGAITNFDFTSAGTGGSAALDMSTFMVDYTGNQNIEFDVTLDGGAAQTVLLDRDYSGDVDAANLAADIEAQLAGATVTYDGFNITITDNAVNTAAPVVDNFNNDPDGDTVVSTAADFTGTEVGTAGTAAGAATEFEVDGNNVSLNADYTNLAGLVAEIQTQLGADYVVAASGSGFSISSASTAAATAKDVIFGAFKGPLYSEFEGGTYVAGVNDVAAETVTGFSDLDISTVGGADEAILAMDAALAAVNSSRADLGAIQNRFSSVVANLQTTSENLSASRSRIMDADFAKETAELTRTQILQQAGTAMLAQANAVPQNVLSLLR